MPQASYTSLQSNLLLSLSLSHRVSRPSYAMYVYSYPHIKDGLGRRGWRVCQSGDGYDKLITQLPSPLSREIFVFPLTRVKMVGLILNIC